jgi:hypothetical protein
MTEIGRTPGGVPIAAWILKGDPKVFDVDGAFEEGVIDSSWSVYKTYRSELLDDGQRCYMWRSGRDAAIIAAGQIRGPVELSQATVQNWVDQDKAKLADLFVPVELYLLGQEITRARLRSHPVLANLEILRIPQGSNPSILTPEEFDALEELVSDIEESDGPLAAISAGGAVCLVVLLEDGEGFVLLGESAEGKELEPIEFDSEKDAVLAGAAALAHEIAELPSVEPSDLEEDEVPVVRIRRDRNDYILVFKIPGGFMSAQFIDDDLVEVVNSDLSALVRDIYDEVDVGSY